MISSCGIPVTKECSIEAKVPISVFLLLNCVCPESAELVVLAALTIQPLPYHRKDDKVVMVELSNCATTKQCRT